MQKNYLKKKTSGETPVNSFKCIFRKSEDNVKKKKNLQYGHLMIFDNIKKKHDVYKEKDCMKKFCEYLQDEAIKH